MSNFDVGTDRRLVRRVARDLDVADGQTVAEAAIRVFDDFNTQIAELTRERDELRQALADARARIAELEGERDGLRDEVVAERIARDDWKAKIRDLRLALDAAIAETHRIAGMESAARRWAAAWKAWAKDGYETLTDIHDEITPAQRAALEAFEQASGFEPMYQDQFAEGGITFAELCRWNEQWLVDWAHECGQYLTRSDAYHASVNDDEHLTAPGGAQEGSDGK